MTDLQLPPLEPVPMEGDQHDEGMPPGVQIRQAEGELRGKECLLMKTANKSRLIYMDGCLLNSASCKNING